MNDAIRLFENHLHITVRLTPNAGRDAIEGFDTNDAGETYLKVRVTAVPEKGRANKALIELLAKSLGVSKSRVSLASGETSRQKILRIDGDAEDLKPRLAAFTST